MQRYITFVVRHRVAVVVAVLVATALLATQLRHLHLEIRRRANLPNEHPYVQIQNRIADLFGGEGVVIIGVVANTGSVYTPQILGKIRRITEGLIDTRGAIEASLFSIAGPYVKTVENGPDDTMEVRTLMAAPPESAEEIERIRQAIAGEALFRGNLVSADETAAVIVVDFDDQIQDRELVARIEELVDRERDDTVTIALAGAPILRGALAEYTAMMGILFPLAVVVIALVHYEAFRTVQAMVLPLVTALLSVVWALGIMGALGLPMDTWSVMTPVLILAVAAGHAVQILKRYYEEYARAGDTHQAVIRAVTAVGPVMLTAGFIAASGFGSLVTFDVTSVRVFGLLLASGILSALVIEMTFTPACRSLLPAPRSHEVRREGEELWLDRALDAIADVVVRRPRAILAAAGGLLVLSAAGASTMQVDNSFRFWFAPSTQVRQDDAVLNARLSGTATLRILVEGEEENALLDPAVLRAMSDLGELLDAEPQVAGVMSIADHVKRMHRAMHGGDPAYYAIPDDSRVVGEYLFLYGMAAGPDGLNAFVDVDHRSAVIRALSKTDTAVYSRELLIRLQQFAQARFRDLPVQVGVAGGTLGVQTAMNDVVVREKAVNMVQITAIIFALCSLVLRSVVGGLFVLVPLGVAVMVNFGIMGWSRTWLDMTTATITAMGVSIGADFAIYLIFRMREEWRRDEVLENAVRASLRTSGKAIFFVSSAVAAGYMVLTLSGFSIWMRLGALTAIIVSVSALAAITLIPALALVFRPRFLRRSARAATGFVSEQSSPAAETAPGRR